YTATGALGGIGVDVAAVDDDVVGEFRQRVFVPAELYERIGIGGRGGGELDADEAIVVSAGGGLHRGGPVVLNIGGDDLRHGAGVRGAHAHAGSGQGGVGRRGADDDPATAGLVGQREGSGEGGTGLQHDHVTERRGVQRR